MVILVGMAQITKHVNRCEATVKDWIDKKGFPAYKIDGIWEADSEEVDVWRKDRIRMAKTSQPQTFLCSRCGRFFGSKGALATHQKACSGKAWTNE